MPHNTMASSENQWPMPILEGLASWRALDSEGSHNVAASIIRRLDEDTRQNMAKADELHRGTLGSIGKQVHPMILAAVSIV